MRRSRGQHSSWLRPIALREGDDRAGVEILFVLFVALLLVGASLYVDTLSGDQVQADTEVKPISRLSSEAQDLLGAYMTERSPDARLGQRTIDYHVALAVSGDKSSLKAECKAMFGDGTECNVYVQNVEADAAYPLLETGEPRGAKVPQERGWRPEIDYAFVRSEFTTCDGKLACIFKIIPIVDGYAERSGEDIRVSVDFKENNSAGSAEDADNLLAAQRVPVQPELGEAPSNVGDNAIREVTTYTGYASTKTALGEKHPVMMISFRPQSIQNPERNLTASVVSAVALSDPASQVSNVLAGTNPNADVDDIGLRFDVYLEESSSLASLRKGAYLTIELPRGWDLRPTQPNQQPPYWGLTATEVAQNVKMSDGCFPSGRPPAQAVASDPEDACFITAFLANKIPAGGNARFSFKAIPPLEKQRPFDVFNVELANTTYSKDGRVVAGGSITRACLVVPFAGVKDSAPRKVCPTVPYPWGQTPSGSTFKQSTYIGAVFMNGQAPGWVKRAAFDAPVGSSLFANLTTGGVRSIFPPPGTGTWEIKNGGRTLEWTHPTGLFIGSSHEEPDPNEGVQLPQNPTGDDLLTTLVNATALQFLVEVGVAPSTVLLEYGENVLYPHHPRTRVHFDDSGYVGELRDRSDSAGVWEGEIVNETGEGRTPDPDFPAGLVFSPCQGTRGNGYPTGDYSGSGIGKTNNVSGACLRPWHLTRAAVTLNGTGGYKIIRPEGFVNASSVGAVTVEQAKQAFTEMIYAFRAAARESHVECRNEVDRGDPNDKSKEYVAPPTKTGRPAGSATSWVLGGEWVRCSVDNRAIASELAAQGAAKITTTFTLYSPVTRGVLPMEGYHWTTQAGSALAASQINDVLPLSVTVDRYMDAVIAGDDGVIYAMDGKDGHIIWRKTIGAKVTHLAAIDANRDGKKDEIIALADLPLSNEKVQEVTQYHSTLYAWAFTPSGEKLWSVELKGSTTGAFTATGVAVTENGRNAYVAAKTTYPASPGFVYNVSTRDGTLQPWWQPQDPVATANWICQKSLGGPNPGATSGPNGLRYNWKYCGMNATVEKISIGRGVAWNGTTQQDAIAVARGLDTATVPSVGYPAPQATPPESILFDGQGYMIVRSRNAADIAGNVAYPAIAVHVEAGKFYAARRGTVSLWDLSTTVSQTATRTTDVSKPLFIGRFGTLSAASGVVFTGIGENNIKTGLQSSVVSEESDNARYLIVVDPATGVLRSKFIEPPSPEDGNSPSEPNVGQVNEGVDVAEQVYGSLDPDPVECSPNYQVTCWEPPGPAEGPFGMVPEGPSNLHIDSTGQTATGTYVVNAIAIAPASTEAGNALQPAVVFGGEILGDGEQPHRAIISAYTIDASTLVPTRKWQETGSSDSAYTALATVRPTYPDDNETKAVRTVWAGRSDGEVSLFKIDSNVEQEGWLVWRGLPMDQAGIYQLAFQTKPGWFFGTYVLVVETKWCMGAVRVKGATLTLTSVVLTNEFCTGATEFGLFDVTLSGGLRARNPLYRVTVLPWVNDIDRGGTTNRPGG